MRSALLIPLLLTASMASSTASAEDFPADRVVAAAAGDWDKDGTPDLALVVRPTDESDVDNGLYIYLHKTNEARLALAASLPNTLWGSMMMSGQEPELVAMANGSLQVITKNETIGRERWRQTLTVAYRNFDFIVAGYTFSGYDTVEMDENGENRTKSCDLNVLTGKGKADDKPVTAKAAFVLLKDWDDAIGQKACGYRD